MFKLVSLLLCLALFVIATNAAPRASGEHWGSSEERYYPRYGGYGGGRSSSESHERYYGGPAYFGGGGFPGIFFGKK